MWMYVSPEMDWRPVRGEILKTLAKFNFFKKCCFLISRNVQTSRVWDKCVNHLWRLSHAKIQNVDTRKISRLWIVKYFTYFEHQRLKLSNFWIFFYNWALAAVCIWNGWNKKQCYNSDWTHLQIHRYQI